MSKEFSLYKEIHTMGKFGSLTVLTYNIQCRPAELFKYNETRMENILHFLKSVSTKLEIDVIVLTESFHPTFNRRFQQTFPSWHVHRVLNERRDANLKLSLVPPFLWGNLQVCGGVVTATRVPHDSCHSVEFSSSCQFDSLAAKGALHVQITKDGQIVHIIGTHLQSKLVPFLCDPGVRARQFEEIRSMVSTLEDNGTIGPEDVVLYVGDFNEAAPPEHALTASAVRCEQEPCPEDSRQLDYIMYSRRHKHPHASQTKVIGDRAELANYSDHYPLLGILRF